MGSIAKKAYGWPLSKEIGIKSEIHKKNEKKNREQV